MQSKEHNLKHVAPASSRWISVSTFRRFGISAFQRFSVSAFQRFSVYTLFAMMSINTGYVERAAAQDDEAEAVVIDENAIVDAVADELRLAMFTLQALELPRNLPPRFEVKVTLIEEELTLSLQRFSVRSEAFRLLVQDESGEIKEVPPPPAHTYRGTFLEIDGSEVAASLIDGQLSAVILLPDDGLWAVQPVSDVTPGAPPSWHAVYDFADVQPGPWICGNDDLMQAPSVPGGAGEDESASREDDASPAGEVGERIADIAFDADVEFYQANGSSVPLTMFDIERVVNGGGVIYRRDVSIDHWISAILVRTAEPDPYNTNNAGALLCQFRAEWNANQGGIARDTAHLMTGKTIQGNTIGLAWVGVICNVVRGGGGNCPQNANVAYGFSQSRFSNNFAQRVALTAHEVGHNWSACHCNQSACTGGGVDPDCNIMCSNIGGCTGNVTSFGSRSRTAIVAHRKGRDCLFTCKAVANVPGDADTVLGGIRVACWGGEVAISAGNYDETFRVNKNVRLTAEGGTVTIGK